MSIVIRFAPSPTGYLHLGHAFSAMIAWQHARAAGGGFAAGDPFAPAVANADGLARAVWAMIAANPP